MSQLSSSATSAGELRAVTAYECCLQGQTTLQCTETGYWYDTFSEKFWGRITTDAGLPARSGGGPADKNDFPVRADAPRYTDRRVYEQGTLIRVDRT